MFAALSRYPGIAPYLNLFVALAPVAYVNNQKSALLTLLADTDAVLLFEIFGTSI
jgi:hypothetical protein